MTERCYVYAILARGVPLPSGLAGLDGSALSVVSWRSLAAAVSILDSAEPRPTLENLLRHEAVVEAVRSSGPALPVRFGTVVADLGAVEQALSERYTVLTADLARLGDKVEMGLAVLWDPEELDGKQSCEGRDDEFGVDPISQSGPGARYLMGRLTQHREEILLRSRAQALAKDVDDLLRHNALQTQRVVLPTSHLALRAAYLLEPSRVGAFRGAFEEVRQARPYLRLLLSGPWPPYSFVTPQDTLSSVLLDRLGASTLAHVMR